MMKKITLIITLLTMSFGYSQNFPFTFTPANELMAGDSNAATSIVDDPSDSNNDVLQVIGAGGGDSCWDNAQIVFGNAIDLSSADAMDRTITFRIQATTGSNDVRGMGLQFSDASSGGNLDVRYDLDLTTGGGVNTWYNMSLEVPQQTGRTFGKFVVFVDMQAQSASGDPCNGLVNTYLFDDFAGGTFSTGPSPMYVLPVDFSDEFNHAMTGDSGAGASIITDPDDGTNKVLQIVGNGSAWDNAQVTFPNPLDLSDDNNNTMRFRMRSTTADVSEVNKHIVKFENPTSGGDVQVVFSTVGQNWTDVKADFPGGLSSYGKIVIMVDWGNNTADPDQSSADQTETYLVDDIMAPGATVLSIDDFKVNKLQVYPNPTQSSWNISTQSQKIEAIEVFDVLGKKVWSVSPNTTETQIDGTNLKSGLYFAQIKTPNNIESIKLVKK